MQLKYLLLVTLISYSVQKVKITDSWKGWIATQQKLGNWQGSFEEMLNKGFSVRELLPYYQYRPNEVRLEKLNKEVRRNVDAILYKMKKDENDRIYTDSWKEWVAEKQKSGNITDWPIYFEYMLNKGFDLPLCLEIWQMHTTQIVWKRIEKKFQRSLKKSASILVRKEYWEMHQEFTGLIGPQRNKEVFRVFTEAQHLWINKYRDRAHMIDIFLQYNFDPEVIYIELKQQPSSKTLTLMINREYPLKVDTKLRNMRTIAEENEKEGLFQDNGWMNWAKEQKKEGNNQAPYYMLNHNFHPSLVFAIFHETHINKFIKRKNLIKVKDRKMREQLTKWVREELKVQKARKQKVKKDGEQRRKRTDL